MDNIRAYTGHENQCRGVDELRLSGGKANELRILSVRNGKGLEFWISLDRCADIPRLSCNGVNYGFLSPCGFAAPEFYDKNEFLKNFTAGFFTTCGFENAGASKEYKGKTLPMHGTCANIPAEWFMHDITEDEIIIKARIRDAVLFGRKLVLLRTYRVSLVENTITLEDEVENIGGSDEYLMLLYHCNMGYPLLSEKAVMKIPHSSVRPHNARAAEGIDDCLVIEKPQDGFEEQCYYYDVLEKDGYCTIGIENPENNAAIELSWNKKGIDCFTQWKMMGSGEYVMGLEPGNCTPEGVEAMEKAGKLKVLKPHEKYKTELIFRCGLR